MADVSGYTDYGRVWREFLALVEDDLHPRATVIVLGDARTNGRDPRADVFARIAARAGRTFWLNPEPRLYWNYGDSRDRAPTSRYCEAYECWTTRQLEDFVKALTRPQLRLTRYVFSGLERPLSFFSPAYDHAKPPAASRTCSVASTEAGRARSVSRLATLTVEPYQSPQRLTAGPNATPARSGGQALGAVGAVDQPERGVHQRRRLGRDEHHRVADLLDDLAPAARSPPRPAATAARRRCRAPPTGIVSPSSVKPTRSANATARARVPPICPVASCSAVRPPAQRLAHVHVEDVLEPRPGERQQVLRDELEPVRQLGLVGSGFEERLADEVAHRLGVPRHAPAEHALGLHRVLLGQPDLAVLAAELGRLEVGLAVHALVRVRDRQAERAALALEPVEVEPDCSAMSRAV